jgi:hypothetical protein
MVKVLYVTKQPREDYLGKFASHADYDTLIDEDTDVYEYDPFDPTGTSEERVILKFRKQAFTAEQQIEAYKGLIDAAIESNNRGIAAGPRSDSRNFVTDRQYQILDFLLEEGSKLEDETLEEFLKKPMPHLEDSRGTVWLANKLGADSYEDNTDWFEVWLEKVKTYGREAQRAAAKYVAENYISNTTYAEPVFSGIAGSFGRYPRIPFKRLTSYTERNYEIYQKSFPYLRRLDHEFEKLLPVRYKFQREAANKIDSKFLVDMTCFTTLTINKNFRTAYHRDKGDLSDGFSNLTAIGDWKGAYLVLPEVRAAVNLRPGDLLLVANHSYIHGNTKFEGDRNLRMSIVAYFREDMLEPGSYEYESLRRQYVEERRKNKDHKLQRPLWNGVSPKMWDEQEWRDYMKKHNIADPYAKKKSGTIDAFFGEDE